MWRGVQHGVKFVLRCSGERIGREVWGLPHDAKVLYDARSRMIATVSNQGEIWDGQGS